MRTSSFFVAISFFALSLCPILFGAEPSKPNILLVLADDIGFGDFSCYNPEGKIQTAAIDRLAATGMRFTSAYAPAAVCAPTRYAILTGNYPWRGMDPEGTWDRYGRTAFRPGQKTFGHFLQSANYRTAMFGKANVGAEYERMLAPDSPDFSSPLSQGPIQWGFDYSYIMILGHQGPPYAFYENNRMVGDPSKIVNLESGPLNGGAIGGRGPGLPDWDSSNVGRQLTEKAIAFIDDHLAKNKAEGKDRPFMIHFNTDGDHAPYTPSETLFGKQLKGETRMNAKTDMILEVDFIVEHLVTALKQRGLYENTLIILTSDNGGITNTGELQAFGHDAVGGLRGLKTNIWEGGVRVPLIMHWGDDTQTGSKIRFNHVSHQMIGLHDLVPTFCEIAGIQPGDDQMLDSISFLPVLLGKNDDSKQFRQSLIVQACHRFDAFTARPKEFDPQTKDLDPRERHEKWVEYMNKRYREGKRRGLDGIGRAVIMDGWKLCFNLTADEADYLSDMNSDPVERNNLLEAAHAREKRDELEKEYRRIRASNRSTPPLRVNTR